MLAVAMRSMGPAKTVAWLVLGLFIFLAGLGHFTHTSLYAAFMPDWMPLGWELVYVSGVVEMGVALLLLWPRTTRVGAWAMVATLIAIFPANLNHALSGGIDDPALPAFFADPILAWIRVPFQLVFIAWAWWFTRPPLPLASREDDATVGL